MFRFSHKESYEYELPGTWLFRMIDFYITNLKMCSGRWTSILTSLRTYLHHWGSMSCSISWFALFTGVTFQGVWVVMEKYSSWSRPKRVLESDPARCETNSPCSEGDLWLLQFGQWTWFCSRSIFHLCTDVSELSIWWIVLKHTFFLKFKRMIGIMLRLEVFL
jgi:hypothetical protein